MMPTIEKYFHDGPGYEPFLIRDGWQVAQLNFLPELRPEAIRRVERHRATDEVFVLIQGGSLLFAAVECSTGPRLEVCRMRPGVTYNIPAGTWHGIAMAPGDLVLIVEKAHTHLHDVEYRELNPQEYEALQSLLQGKRIHDEGDEFTRTLHDGASGRHGGPHSGRAADLPLRHGDGRDHDRPDRSQRP